MTDAISPRDGATAITPDPAARALFHLGFPLLGAGAGWLVKQLAGWAASASWMPYQDLLVMVDSWPDPYTTIGMVVLGAVAGAVVGHIADNEALHAVVRDDVVVLGRGSSARRVARADATAVFLHGTSVVVLGPGQEELVRYKADIDQSERDRMAAVFLEHGWPWHADGDPHEDAYRRWVEDTPLLPAATNAVLKARQRALDRGDQDDAQQLREELARLDVVVRDDDAKRQFWRSSGPR